MGKSLPILILLIAGQLHARLPQVDFSVAVEISVPVDFEAMESLAGELGRTSDALRKLAASYLAAHRVQEAIWTLREAGDFDEALELTRKFQTYLSTQPMSGVEFLGGHERCEGAARVLPGCHFRSV